MKTAKNTVVVVLFLIFIVSSYLTYKADQLVNEHLETIKNNRVNQDVNVYAQPKLLRIDDYIEPLTNELFSKADVINASSVCKDINQDPLITFGQLPHRCFCLNLKNGFIKQASPLPSYIFNLKVAGKKLVITKILNEAGNEISEAEIYFDPKAIFKIDENGEVEAQIRQKLVLNRSNLESDVVKMLLLLEGSRSFEKWNQGTDWIGVGRAVIQTGLQPIGLGGENIQGASSPFEQYAKIALIDPYSPPAAELSVAKTDTLSSTFWESSADFFKKIYKMFGKTKRRVISAYAAESLLQYFSKEDIILRWSSETNFGIEMSNYNKGKLSHPDQQKELLLGARTAAQALFNRNSLDELQPVEVATLGIAPRQPALLRILQKNPAKRTISEQEKIAKQSSRYLKRVKNALIVFANDLEKQGKSYKAKTYRDAAEKIPIIDKADTDHAFIKLFNDFFGLSTPKPEISDEEKIAKFEEFKAMLPSLRINEDDKMSAENLQIMERQSLRDEVAKIIDDKKLSYTQIKKLKLTVVTSTNPLLQNSLSNLLENVSEKDKIISIDQIQNYLEKKLSARNDPFSFGLLVENIVSDRHGRIIASVAMRYENGKIIPNRLFVHYPTYMGSTAKIFHNTAALDSGKIALNTEICVSQSKSPNGFMFEGTPPIEECMSAGEGLQRSRNWVQSGVRNIVGTEIANAYWSRIAGQQIKYPADFDSFSPFEKDRWFYEQTRGVNAESVSKSVIEVVGMFTAMANDGVKTNPTFIQKLWLGKELTQVRSEQTNVFSPDSVKQISALMQANGKNAFNLGDESPAVKTGSLANAYWNAVWSRNLVIVSRVAVLPPTDEETEKKIAYLRNKIKNEQAELWRDNAKITAFESELNKTLDEKKTKVDAFLKKLAKKSNAVNNPILAKDVIQPFNQKAVALIYSKHKFLFTEQD